MDTLTTLDCIANEPKVEDFDILRAFAQALSEPEPMIVEEETVDEQEAFLKLARAH